MGVLRAKKNHLSLNAEFKQLLALICESISDFRHYDTSKIALSISRSNSKGKHGTWAYVVPLKLPSSKLSRLVSYRGRQGFFEYRSERIQREVPEARYLMTILVPKFFKLSLQERFETLVHELYHFAPEFNGELRRFKGKHKYHGPTPTLFKKQVRALTQEASTNLPELLRHPLLTESDSHFDGHTCKRFEIPRYVFSPLSNPEPKALPRVLPSGPFENPSWFSQFSKNILSKWVGLGLLLFATLAHAEIDVIAKRSRLLKASPALNAPDSIPVQARENMVALKTNADKTWLYVRAKSGEGWIPRHQVSVSVLAPSIAPTNQASDFANDERSVESPNLPVERGIPISAAQLGRDEEIKDPEVKVPEFERLAVTENNMLTVKRKGQLFERPDPTAPRYGVIEEGDEVKVLGESKNRSWVNVRLNITGEEGWLPREWLISEELQSSLWLDKADSSLEAVVGWGTNDHNAGIGLGYYYALLGARRRGDNFADRIEIGTTFSYFVGSTTEISTPSGLVNYSARYFIFPLILRYQFNLGARKVWSLIPEAGLFYQKAFVSGTGIPAESLKTLGLSENPTYVGILGGGRVAYLFDEFWQASAGIKAYLMNESFVSFDAGVGYRF